MRRLILPTLCAALYACVPAGGEVTYTSGTYVQGGGGTYVQSTTYVETPDLVTVQPGVQVIADYDEPVFYTDGFYWRFNDGVWYRSNNYASGWVYYDAPPARLRVIDRPYEYRHYRPNGYVVRNRGPYRPAEPIVRDHRDYRTQPAAPAYRQPEPVVRDHRTAPAPVYQPTAPAPVVRDHRTAPAPTPPAPKPVVRDHRH